MKFNILDRWTGSVIFTAEIECDESASYSIKLGLAVKVAVQTDANLTDANLTDANLYGADLTGADLYGADLTDANLTDANLTDANLYGADLTDANLTDANLYGADLTGANLYGADLTGANLYGADLTGADLTGADLTGANLYGANLYGAKELAKAKWDADGKMVCTIPPVFFLGATWPVMISDVHIKIGCQVHATTEWREFSDEQIARMDGISARRFRKQWKVAVLALAEAHQSKVAAEPEAPAEAAE